jgi:NitT/TauT family transport system substrate-binding protein
MWSVPTHWPIVRISALLTGTLLVACTPAASAPTAAPAKPAAEAAKPAVEAKPAASPATAAAPAAKPAAPAPGQAAAPAGRSVMPIVVRQGWKSAGTNAPMFLAIDKGWYSEEGLDVSMPEGTGTNPVLQVIGSGREPMAVKVGAGAVALGISQGVPVKAVAVVYQKNPASVFCRREVGLNSAKALEGRRVGGTAGDESTILLPAFLKANGVDPSKVEIVNLDAAARINAFLNGQVDCSVGYVNDTFVVVSREAGRKGWELDVLPFADNGVPIPGDVIIANKEFLDQNPDAVRGFVRTTIKAYNHAKANPDEAIAALVKTHPTLDPTLEREKLLATYRLMDTPLTQQHGYGFSEPAQWEKLQDVLAEYMGLTNKSADVAVYYSNDFLK